jgi:hypothetical protein
MAPGDTQEVIYALIGGLGNNNLSSVAAMKYNVSIAHHLHHHLYQIPERTSAPVLETMSLNGRILLNWENDFKAAETLEQRVLNGDYTFEGYNIRQLPAGSSDLKKAVRIATFDQLTAPAAVKGPYFDTESGLILEEVLAWGNNSGIKRQLLVDYDYLTNGPLIDGKLYRFAVSVYYYNSEPDNPFPVRESEPAFVDVTVYSDNPGYTASFGDTLPWVHSQGKSDGSILVEVVDPSQLTNHEYEIFFTEDTNINSATFGEMLWYLLDLMTNDTLLTSNDFYVPSTVIDGLRITIFDPGLDFKSFQVVANAAGPLDPPEQGCFNNGFPLLNGSDRPDSTRQQTNGSTWLIHHNSPGSPSYSSFFSRVTQFTGGFGERETGLRYLIPRNYEIRFTETPGPAFYRWPYLDGPNPAFIGTVPFELWCVGDVNDPGDDYQCFPWISDDDSSGTFNLLDVDHQVSGGTNDPYTDSFYWIEPLSRNQTSFDALLAAHEADPAGASGAVLWAYKTDYDPWNCVAGMMHMVFVNHNGGNVSGGVYNAELPEPGTIFRIITNKLITASDVFTFTAPGEPDVPKLFRTYQNYPNPFNNNTTIRYWVPRSDRVLLEIYNILGQKVTTLVDRVKEQGEYFQTWDAGGLASGIYFYRMSVGAEEKLRKMILVK